MSLGNLTAFQTTLLIIFGVATVGGLAAFALMSGGGGSSESASLVMWGPYDEGFMNSTIDTFEENNENINITYRRVSYDDFANQFVEALADGEGPDLVFLTNEGILKHRNRLYTVPFNAYGERAFKDTFVEAAEIFLTPEGTLGLPVTVDPIVMYWNRSLFNQAGIVSPPEQWSQFNTDQYQQLTKRNDQRIEQSLLALGGYENITNAKSIITTLMMQAGTPVVDMDTAGSPRVLLEDRLNFSVSPGVAAVTFYTQFADPSKRVYSWNNSLPESQQFFISTDLAVYFGFASEWSHIRSQNPNLNVDVAPVPQRSEGQRTTTARIEAIVITERSANKAAAFTAARELSGTELGAEIVEHRGVAPARRDLLAKRPAQAHRTVFYDSVFQAQGWLDPDPAESDDVFREMIQNIRSGRFLPRNAVGRADADLEALAN